MVTRGLAIVTRIVAVLTLRCCHSDPQSCVMLLNRLHSDPRCCHIARGVVLVTRSVVIVTRVDILCF